MELGLGSSIHVLIHVLQWFLFSMAPSHVALLVGMFIPCGYGNATPLAINPACDWL